MAEKKKTKTRAAKDTGSMSVTIAGEVYRLTSTDEAVLAHLALDGFCDNIMDAPSTMTLKAGFTEAERTAKRREVEKNLNAGTFRTAKVAVVNIAKATEKVTAVMATINKLTPAEKIQMAKMLAKMNA